MEPLLIILVPGVVGGIILAVLLATRQIALRTGGGDRRLAPPSPSLINMAHIPVEGGGGLGIVAAVIAVALADPRIRIAIGIAALFGADPKSEMDSDLLRMKTIIETGRVPHDAAQPIPRES